MPRVSVLITLDQERSCTLKNGYFFVGNFWKLWVTFYPIASSYLIFELFVSSEFSVTSSVTRKNHQMSIKVA